MTRQAIPEHDDQDATYYEVEAIIDSRINIPVHTCFASSAMERSSMVAE